MTTTISRRSIMTTAGLALGGTAIGLASAVAVPARAQTGGLIRLIANENPYGPSPRAREALAGAIDESWKYASREANALKKLIAEREQVATANVMLGAGSAEILRLAAMIHGRAGGEVVAARPTFSFLPNYARTLGCTVREVPLDEQMRHDLDAFAAVVGSATRLIYICNPNNPTGTLIDGARLRDFISAMSADAPVVVDEAYLDLWDDLPAHTAVPRVTAGDRVIVTRTFSKLHGLAGLRIGYAIGPGELIEQLEAFRISVLNIAGLRAAQASYQDLEFQRFSREKIQQGLRFVSELFDELELEYVPSRGNFVFFNTGGSPREFMAAMRRAGIMTGLSYAPYATWSRVSMGTIEQMHRFGAAARAYFSA